MTLAPASVASARAVPARSKPRLAKAAVPTTMKTSAMNRPTVSGRQPSSAPNPVSNVTWIASTQRTAHTLPDSRSARDSGVAPKRFKTP